MDLNFSASERDFREEVRNFIRKNLPCRLSEKVRRGQRLEKRDYEEWHAILHARGWLAAAWPVEWGGTGWSYVERHIFSIEAAAAFAPHIQPFGLTMIGPVLIKYGSEEQKRRWLPRILDGSDWWCQGYSEPGAGSDLAAVRTTAVRDGDDYIVNGQKTWTTYGHYANMIFCLVRTDPAAKKQAGISFIVVDMAMPGVEVRPIITLDGEHEVNEIFFTDVRVPAAHLIGEENSGWTYAKYLLTHERTGAAFVGESLAELGRLKHHARALAKDGKPLCEDRMFATRLARLEIDLDNLQVTTLRILAASAEGAAPMAESAMLKIRGSELRQDIASLARRALGPYAQLYIAEALEEGFSGDVPGPPWATAATVEYLNGRKHSIYAGSNEVQRGIITKTMLEL